MQVRTASEIVDALGGTGAVARLVNITPGAISHWRRDNRIPPRSYLILAPELERIGIEVHPSILGIPEPERA